MIPLIPCILKQFVYTRMLLKSEMLERGLIIPILSRFGVYIPKFIRDLGSR